MIQLVIKKLLCNVGLGVVGAYDWSQLTPVNLGRYHETKQAPNNIIQR